nr:hypothetical protein [Sphingomonas parva]
MDGDAVDQRRERLGRPGSDRVVVQGVLQVPDLLLEQLEQGRMREDVGAALRCRWRHCLEVRLLALEFGEHAVQRRTRFAYQHVAGKRVDLPLQLREPQGRIAGLPVDAFREPTNFALELADEQLSQLRRKQTTLQDREHGALQSSLADGEAIVARPSLLHAGAAIIVLAGDRVVRAARPAPDRAGEEVLAPPLHDRGGRDARIPSAARQLRLNGIPEAFVNDTHVGHVDPQPLGLVSQTVAPFALVGVGILAPLPPLPYELAAVERVVEDADQLLRIAPNRRRIPGAAARAWDSFLVQPLGDCDRREAGGKFVEDAPHDLRLLVLDLETAADGLTPRIDPHDLSIAVRAAAGEPTRDHGGLHAPESFELQVCEKHRPEQAGDSELHVVDFILGDCEEPDPIIAQLLAEPGDVLAVTCETIEGLRDDDVDLAVSNIGQQGTETRSVALVAGDLAIEVGSDHLPAEVIDQRHAGGGLVGARHRVLLVRRVAAVDGNPGLL